MTPEAAVKITQYCSVCRDELAMEVVPTGDGEDDGVIWLRCPRCQGFLPKIGDSLTELGGGGDQPAEETQATAAAPADSVAAGAAAAAESRAEGVPPAEKKDKKDKSPAVPDEITEAYRTMLAEMDVSRAVPYRPWEKYEVGDVIHHLAWDDCGVVVDKEHLPGNRSIIMVYFEKTGIVRLIEEDKP